MKPASATGRPGKVTGTTSCAKFQPCTPSYVDDGDILTSAGAAAGIDLCLHLVRKDHGTRVANALARRIVVPPHRSVERGGPVERAVGHDGPVERAAGHDGPVERRRPAISGAPR
jgi:hypothetical protein